MPAFTSFLNLYKPGGGSTGLITPDEVVDIDRINANMDLIDANAALWGPASKRNMQFTDLAANKGAVTGMKLGDTYQETDGAKRLWTYDGGNWVSGQGGLFLIAPSSVVGGTLDADGYTVHGDGTATSLSINGVFSSRFRKYQIDYWKKYVSGTGTILARLRVGGVDEGSANYFSQSLEGSGANSTAPISFGAYTNAQWNVDAGARGFGAGRLELFNPATTGTDMDKAMSWRGFTADVNSTITAAVREGTLWSKTAVAFDGITLYGGGAFTTSSWFKVYGIL